MQSMSNPWLRTRACRPNQKITEPPGAEMGTSNVGYGDKINNTVSGRDELLLVNMADLTSAYILRRGCESDVGFVGVANSFTGCSTLCCFNITSLCCTTLLRNLQKKNIVVLHSVFNRTIPFLLSYLSTVNPHYTWKSSSHTSIIDNKYLSSALAALDCLPISEMHCKLQSSTDCDQTRHQGRSHKMSLQINKKNQQ